MKKILALAVCIAIFAAAQAQNAVTVKEKKSFKVEFGWGMFYNEFNQDDYLNMNYPAYAIFGQDKMFAFNLKFTTETRYRNLDLIFGAITLIGQNSGSLTIDHAGYPYKMGYQYLMNGGGVYAGISPKLKTKYFGLTSDFAVGLFPIKEYASAVVSSEEYPDFANVNQSKASVFGAMVSLGIYVKVWRIGINPTLNVIYAGGANTSFLLYGFMLPLTITF